MGGSLEAGPAGTAAAHGTAAVAEDAAAKEGRC